MLAGILVAFLVAACGDTGEPAPSKVTFVFRLAGLPASEEFRHATDSEMLIAAARAQLALPPQQRNLFPAGPIAAGDGGHNRGWSWHFTDMQLVRAAIELCDGTPSFVESDLDYWLNTVGSYCPWLAYVYAEEN